MRSGGPLGAALLAVLIVGCSAGDDVPEVAPASSAPAADTPAARGTTTPSAPPSPRPTATDLPRVVAAIGDSITTVVNPDRETFGEDRSRSWATGENPDDGVSSHVERLRQAGADVTAVHNLAVAGAQVADGPDQARNALAVEPHYVTVALGANDACRGASITSVAEFEQYATQTLRTLATGQPYIFVMSVPDVTRLWSVARGQPNARAVWDEFEICRNVLPTGATEGTREAVRDQIEAYNKIWARLCAASPRCRYDDGAVFARPFTVAEVSPLDFFHPSTTGQAQLAETTWRAGWWPHR